jgi:putative flippase GtrA
VPRNWRELREWSRSYEGKKLIRFTTTSLISTLISETSILITYGFKIIPGEIQATLFSNVLAMLPAYHLNRRWAWGKRGRSKLRSEVLPYLGMSFTGTIFSLLGATYARHVVHAHHWGHLINTGIVGGTNIGAFAIFWVLKMLLFNRIFHPGHRPTTPDQSSQLPHETERIGPNN